MRRSASKTAWGILAGAALAGACGGGRPPLYRDRAASGGAGTGAVDAQVDGGIPDFGASSPDAPGACPGKTTVSGTVFDPRGQVPLYNVLVYVPSAPLEPMPNGATCDRCGGGGSVSGKPVAVALSDESGHFVLEGVPSGIDVPLVMQVGKWRRQVAIPKVVACRDNPLADPELTRLPRNRKEGDLPKIAVVTGAADPLECLLRKIGIDDAEFKTADDPGAVHMFGGYGYEVPSSNGGPFSVEASRRFVTGQQFDDASALWDDLDTLRRYDIVLLACEGDSSGNPSTKSPAAREALYAYARAGGRVFASHFHDIWFREGPDPLPEVATWARDTPPGHGQKVLSDIDTSFPKGAALKTWLGRQGELEDGGRMPIWEARHDVDAVRSELGVKSWITVQNDASERQAGMTAVSYLSFNAPLGAAEDAQCGRVVYSDLHVASADHAGWPFPQGCVSSRLSAQEKALEFMLFDLSSCVQKDDTPPVVPR